MKLEGAKGWSVPNLYERFITSSIHSRNGDIEKERYAEVSKDFDGAVSPDDFKVFSLYVLRPLKNIVLNV